MKPETRAVQTSEEGRQEPARREPVRDVLWITTTWGRVVLGLALAAIAGVSFGHAWSNESTSLWVVGGVTLLTGVLLVLSGLYVRNEPEPPPAPKTEEEREELIPLLGALLVYKYQLISHAQLQHGLEEQRRSTRLIGEILVEQGLVTEGQVQVALAHQLSCSEAREASPVI